jgi:hypothetical protein
VERLVAELLLERAALRHVAVVDDHALDGPIVEQVLGDGLDDAVRPIHVAGAELGRGLDLRRRHDVGEQALHAGQVLGMDELERLPADPRIRSVAQDALDARALVRHGPVRAGDHDPVGCVPDERPEPLFVAAQVVGEHLLVHGLLTEEAVVAAQQARRAREGQ